MKKARYVKVLCFTYNNEEAEIESAVNASVKKITELGGSVVSHMQKSFGISPMKFYHTIVYDRIAEITQNEWETGESVLQSNT
jgi:Uri superfamily endonuclease